MTMFAFQVITQTLLVEVIYALVRPVLLAHTVDNMLLPCVSVVQSAVVMQYIPIFVQLDHTEIQLAVLAMWDMKEMVIHAQSV